MTVDERRAHPGSDRLLALVAVLAAALQYAWVPQAYFYADDFLHLYDAVNLAPLDFILQPHGGHLYVVRNLVLHLTLALAGPSPAAFQTTAFAGHVVNVWLLFWLIRRFTSSPALAFLGALLWGTNPDVGTTIGWYSVFGQVLATTVMLGILASVGRWAEGDEPPPLRTVCAWVGFAWIGATCFGSGLAFGGVLPLVVGLLVPRAWAERRTRALLLGAPVGVVVMYLVLPALHAQVDPLRSEPSVLGFNLHELWVERGFLRVGRYVGLLVGRGVTGLFAAVVPEADPPVLPALLGWLLLCVLALWRGSTRERRTLLAFMLPTLAAYGAVAIGRQFNANAVTEPRYQYFAQAPLMVTLALLGARLPRLRLAASPLPALVGAMVMAALLLGARGALEPYGLRTRPVRRQQVERFDLKIGTVARQAPEGGVIYFANAPWFRSYYQMPRARFPGYSALFCLLHPDGEIDGRAIRFVESDPVVLAAAVGGRCSGTTLVAAAPPGTLVRPAPDPPRAPVRLEPQPGTPPGAR